MIDVFLDMTFIYSNPEEGPADADSSSVISLDNGMVLYMYGVNRFFNT